MTDQIAEETPTPDARTASSAGDQQAALDGREPGDGQGGRRRGGRLQDAVPPGPEDTEDPPASPLSGKYWWAAAALAAVLLIAYWLFLRDVWDTILSPPGARGRAAATPKAIDDKAWAQLSFLIGKVDFLVLFVLGALFGHQVQQRQTMAAREVAERNKLAAHHHHETARANHRAAQANRDVARDVARRSLATMDTARHGLTQLQRSPDTLFVRGAGQAVAALQGSQQSLAFEPSEVSATAPEIDDILDDLESAAGSIRDEVI